MNPWLDDAADRNHSSIPGEITDHRNKTSDALHDDAGADDSYGEDDGHWNGDAPGTGRADDEYIEEELNDARRFEDFETIDWIQDTLFERARRQRELRTAQKKQQQHQRPSRYHGQSTFRAGFSSEQLRAWFTTILHATQSWLVVTLVGAAIGVNAALVDIITSWLTDLKFGYCRVSWWLNSKFCCWEIEPIPSTLEATLEATSEAMCEDWRNWSDVFFGLGYVIYVFYAILFAFSAAFLVRSFAPYAAGSGISEVKCILAGFVMKGFLGAMVLMIKSLTLPLAIASGLSVGKEGPSVHVACAIGNVVGRFFGRFGRSQAKMREIVTAASAAGVAVAFGSPIGGVLFALEEMTVNFPIKTMWRSFFCALIATMTLSAINPFRTGKLVLFQVSYDRDWHFFEIGGFILIGIFGGLYGAFVIKYNLQVQSFRKKHLAKHGVMEAVVLAALTALVGYHNRFLRIDMTESLDILFRECSGGGDYDGLCQTWAQWRMVNSLLLATVLRIVLIIISYGAKVPAGIFVPSMAVGATFGRMVGILVKAMYRAHPQWAIFAACDPEVPCITPGTYAFLGAAAALGGIMRITVTVVVIMFELTGALTYILPTMIVLMVTKAVSDLFGKGGIADQMIRFNGFPFLDKEDHQFNEDVAHVMKRNVLAIPAVGLRLSELESRYVSSPFRGFPVIQSRKDYTLLGYITRSDIRWAIDKARRTARHVPTNARCNFLKHDEAELYGDEEEEDDEEQNARYDEVGLDSIDFSPWMNETVLTVSSKQPLEIVMQLFKKMGPRVILCEHQGRLEGLITIKDILKEVITQEQFEHPHGNLLDAELEESLEEAHEWIVEKANFVASKLGLKRGSVRLSTNEMSMGERRVRGSESIDTSQRGGAIVFDADQQASETTGSSRLANAFELRS